MTRTRRVSAARRSRWTRCSRRPTLCAPPSMRRCACDPCWPLLQPPACLQQPVWGRPPAFGRPSAFRRVCATYPRAVFQRVATACIPPNCSFISPSPLQVFQSPGASVHISVQDEAKRRRPGCTRAAWQSWRRSWHFDTHACVLNIEDMLCYRVRRWTRR